MTNITAPKNFTIAPLQPKGDKNDIRIICSNVFVFAFSRVAHIVTPRDKDAHADLLADTVNSIMPDVILLQEMSGGIITDHKGNPIDFDWHGRLDPRLQAYGYTEVPVKLAPLPQACIKEGNPEGVNYTPIWYKTELLKLIDHGHKYFDSIAINPDGYLSSSKSYTWALFQEKRTAKRFAAISTHFTYHGDPQKSLKCRIADAKELLLCLDMIEAKYPQTPIILMGDLNSPKNSEPYRLVSERLVDAKNLAATVYNGHLSTCHSIGAFPLIGEAIDHALVSSEGLNVKMQQLIANEGTVNMTDHLPVAIDASLSDLIHNE